MKCTKCFQEKDLECFVDKTKTLKNCSDCRDCRDCREQAKLWRAKNKERISEYNKLKTIEKRNKNETIKVLYGKLVKLEDIPESWTKFESQRDAANKLNLYPSNINKVIKNLITQTGGYMFKLVDETNVVQEVKSWEEIKKEKENHLNNVYHMKL